MKKLIVVLAVIMAACLVMPVLAQPALTSAPADAGVAKLTYGPDKWIDLHLLFQMQYTSTRTWDNTNGEKEADDVWVNDFAPKRMRLMFNGQLAPNLTFFVETDLATSFMYAKKGTFSNPVADSEVTTKNEQYMVFLQDAYINYKVADELQIAFGMILLPFTHLNRQSAVSLLGVNYNTTVVNLPDTTVWRDYGIEFRGLLANKMIDYRVGIFDGVERKVDLNNDDAVTTSDNINDGGMPRITGHVQINLADAEEGFFFSENYLGKKKILSFGGGVDYQKGIRYNDVDKNANVVNDTVDYLAWTVDVVVDYPINPTMVLAFQAAYISAKNRPYLGSVKHTEGVVDQEYGYYAQAGLLLGNIQPVLKYMTWVQQDAFGDKLGDNTVTYLVAGLNYYINGHNANIKIEYQHPMGENESKSNTATYNSEQINQSGEKKITLQAQIYI